MNNNPEDWEGQEGGKRQRPFPEGLNFLHSDQQRADNRTDTIKKLLEKIVPPSRTFPHTPVANPELPMGSAEHPKRLFGETTGKGWQIGILISPGFSCQVMKLLSFKQHTQKLKKHLSHILD